MGRKGRKVFMRSFFTAVHRRAATPGKNRGVFKKSLEFLRGIDIESNRFFARRGKAPRLPAGQQGAMRKIVNTNSSTI